jgi:hypothetical protein
MAKAVPEARPNSAAGSAQLREVPGAARGESSTTPSVASAMATKVSSEARSPRKTIEKSATWITSLLE